MAYEEYSRLLRREPKQDLYFVENPNMITTVADIISNPWKGTPQEYLYNMRQEIKQGLSGFIGNRDNAPMPVNPVNSSMSPPIIAQPEVEPYNYTNKVPEIPLSPTAISEEKTIPSEPIQLWRGDNRALVTPEGTPQPEGYVNRGTFSYTGEQKGRFEPGVKYNLNEPPPPPPTFRDIMKKQMGFDPDEFNAEAEAKRMTAEQIRTVAPRGGLTPQQQAQILHNNLVMAMGQKEKGLEMLAKAEEKFRAETNKSESDNQLTKTALYDPDPIKRQQAQGILDAQQKRKLDIVKENRKVLAEERSAEIDTPLIAEGIWEGKDARMAIRGSMGNPVASKAQTEVLKISKAKGLPPFDFNMSDANYKWKQSAVNQRTINFAGGALPRLSMLDEQLKALPNVDLNTINRLMRAASIEVGKPEYTNFESNRNAIVQEINTALSGSATTSDMRVKIELENLKGARSPEQIRGAISNLREALIARLDVDLSPIYPIEVVRGEKSMQQYKDEMFKKYRGNYKAQTTGSMVTDKKIIDQFYSKATKKTKYVYDDGTEEVK